MSHHGRFLEEDIIRALAFVPWPGTEEWIAAWWSQPVQAPLGSLLGLVPGKACWLRSGLEV